MFTVYVGAVGTGKTFAMVRAAMVAYEKGEPIFSNIDLDPDRAGWDGSNGGRIVRWCTPNDLLSPDIRCGTVLWDELGATVNSREYEMFPLALTIKIIEHRKDHLDFHASVQDDELADKNVRRFYNRVNFTREFRLPLVGLWKRTRRPDLMCGNPNCNKNNHHLATGDHGLLRGTIYRAMDVHPKYTQNKEKHESLGSKWYGYDPRVAMAYQTTGKVSTEAMKYYKDLRRRRWSGGRRTGAGPQKPPPEAV